MQRLIKVCLIAAIALPALALAAVVETNSRIESVVVYTDGATLTRSANVELSAGDNRVRFIGLPASLDEAQIQVALDDADVQIGQVQISREQLSAAVSEAAQQLENALQEAQNKLQALSDSDKSADLTLKFLDSLATGYAKEAWFEGARGNADSASWRTAMTVIENGSNAALKRKRDNVAARKLATAEVDKLKRELQRTRGRGRAKAVVDVAMRAPDARNVTARLLYYTEDAQWQPIYEARLNSNDGRLDLAQRASVYQGTNEPWENITLTLSTSTPEGELTRPELYSEFLDLQQPIAPAPRAKRGATLGMVADASMLEEVVVTAQASAPSTVSNFAVTYAVPGRVNVLNDSDDDQLFDLSRNQFDVALITQVVPRESTSAYLAARFTYDQPLPLYRSDMRVYVDGVYAGETFMPTALPESEVTLPMGQDRRVVVTATDQGGEGGRGGIIGKRQTEVTDFLFKLVNRRQQSTLVEVFDRYPVSRNRSIEVKIPRTATEPTERDWDDEAGLVVWRKQLGAGDSWEIRHQFAISYPANRALTRDY